MREGSENCGATPQKGKLKGPFCRIGNEVFDLFLPIMGPECFTVYAYFTRIEFRNRKLTHSIRGIYEATGISASTVSRSLEILENLGLIKLTRFRGSNDSECQLLDSYKLATSLGAKYNSHTVSFSLPPEVMQRLKAEVNALRKKQQGKKSPVIVNGSPQDCGNPPLPVSQRNAGVSLAIRQSAARETQTWSHLLQEEKRIEEVLSPTPFHDDAALRANAFPDKNEPDPLLKRAIDCFTGVMNDLADHLLNTSRPPLPHLCNGADDWKKYGFDSLAVEAAEWRGEPLALTLSASDPAAAQRGLEKYRRMWDESLRKWFGCKVYCELRGHQ